MTTPEKMQFVGLRLEPSLKAEIEQAASEDGMGFAEWIRAVCRGKLVERWKPSAKRPKK